MKKLPFECKSQRTTAFVSHSQQGPVRQTFLPAKFLTIQMGVSSSNGISGGKAKQTKKIYLQLLQCKDIGV